MKIQIENSSDPGSVLVTCQDQEAALEAQTIMGSRWEALEDMDIAYAMIDNQPNLDDLLELDGYDVDSSEWCPPEEREES